MSAGFFSVPSLVEHLNKITDNAFISTADNINNPTSTYVQTIFFELLKEFGFACPSVVSSDMDLEGLTQNEVNLVKDNLPVDNLLVACRYFYQRLGCDIQFGLLDLVDPKPQRLKKFLSIIVNFWLFANLQMENFNNVRDRVQKHSNSIQQKENQIREIRRKIEDIRQSKAKDEFKATKVKNDMAELDEELLKMTVMAQDIKKNVEPVKQRLAEMKESEAILMKEIEGLEVIERRLQVLVRSDEMKHNLEQELQKANEDFEAMMMQQESYQKKETQLNNQQTEIGAFLEYLHSIQSFLKKVEALSEDLKAKEAELESVRKSIAMKDERQAQIQKESAELKAHLSNIKSKWTKKKSALESELAEFDRKLFSIRQEMSEEDVIACELEMRIHQTRDVISKEERELKEAVMTLKQMYRDVTSAIQAFNGKMDDDLEIIAEASERIDKYLP